MAPLKDWMVEAAVTISQYQLSIGGPLIGGEILKVIKEHCPFKSEVAYMPVPRCETCLYFYQDGTRGKDRGECSLQNGDVPNRIGKVASDCGDWTILVEADFGCVQWETK